MNLNYITKRNHIFKKRKLRVNHRKLKLRIGTVGLFSLKPQRFELIYLRGFKRLLKRKHMRGKMRFKRRKFWIFLRPNCILTSKSVNSRMGAGVGSLVRLTTMLKSYKSFLEFRYYSFFWVRHLMCWTRFKYPLKYFPWTK